MELNGMADRVLTMIITTLIVSCVSIALRVWSRVVVQRGKFSLSDWLAFLALPLVIAMHSMVIAATHHGLGYHVDELSSADISRVMMLFYSSSYLFDLAITLIKLSTLALYTTVFGFRRNPSLFWKTSLSATAIATIAYPFVTTFMYAFACSPPRKLWTPGLPGHCNHYHAPHVGGSAYNVVVDFFILLLPVPEIWKLNMKIRKKILLATSLAIGYCVPIMSIGQVVSYVRAGDTIAVDFTYAICETTLWLLAEPSLGLLAISIPSIFQLSQRWRKFGTSALFSSRDFSQVARARAALGNNASNSSRIERLRRRFLGSTDVGESTDAITRPDANVDDAALDVHGGGDPDMAEMIEESSIERLSGLATNDTESRFM